MVCRETQQRKRADAIVGVFNVRRVVAFAGEESAVAVRRAPQESRRAGGVD